MSILKKKFYEYNEYGFVDIDNIDEIGDASINNVAIKNYKKVFDDDIKKKILDIAYNNEDMMYSAYYKYRDILKYFGDDTTDDDMISLDYQCCNEEYYKTALNKIDKKNIVVLEILEMIMIIIKNYLKHIIVII